MLIAVSSAVALEGIRTVRRARVAHDVVRVVTFIHAALLEASVHERDGLITIQKVPAALLTQSEQCTLSTGVSFVAPAGAQGPPAQPNKPIVSPITFHDEKIICYQTGAATAGTLYIGSPENAEWWALTIPVGENSPIRTYRYHDDQWVLAS